jgi:hypothetical protein
MPGLLGDNVNDGINVSAKVVGRDGIEADTPPVNENLANGNLTAALT